jgi:hypothetical protein
LSAARGGKTITAMRRQGVVFHPVAAADLDVVQGFVSSWCIHLIRPEVSP